MKEGCAINSVNMLCLYKPNFKFWQVKVEKKVCLPDEEYEGF